MGEHGASHHFQESKKDERKSKPLLPHVTANTDHIQKHRHRHVFLHFHKREKYTDCMLK